MNKNNSKEKSLKLDLTLLMQTRNLMFGFLALSSLLFVGSAVADGVDNIKTTKELHKDLYGKTKLSRENKKDLAKDLTGDAIVCVVAFAIFFMLVNTLRTAKRYNDAAAIRIARRYMLKMRNINPELKKYDHILNNEMALYNIACGVANMMLFGTIMEMGADWDALRYRSERVDTKYDELRLKNVAIQSIVNDVRHVAKDNPEFMNKLVVLVESSAKTFVLGKYMENQKVR